ncbi:polysaccharide deacetylase family protein [Leifsonia sp. L25]|uniref:polysaccharide deacetylase family protein n=1 Tax=Actinomycetes TaxID=1760 RepID=UPI003D692D5E
MTARQLAISAVRRSLSFLGSVVSVDTDADEFVLTYDDGPVAGTTDRLMALLGEGRATATFFVLLSRVRRDPGLARALLEAGHEVGLHGVDHVDPVTLAPDVFRRRTADGRRELEDVLGRPVRWYRPPYGHLTVTAWRSVGSAGLTPVLWSASARDGARGLTQQQRIDSATAGLTRGAILLAHDNYASGADGVDDGPEPEVDRLGLAAAVLDAAAAKGLRARSLESALASGRLVKRGVFAR